MTVFEQRRREAALSEDVPSAVTRRHPPTLIPVGIPRSWRKQRTTYAKTGHTVPEKRPAKLPRTQIEYTLADMEKAPHFALAMWEGLAFHAALVRPLTSEFANSGRSASIDGRLHESEDRTL